MCMKGYIQTACFVRNSKECPKSKVKLGKVRKVRKLRQSDESYTKSWMGGSDSLFGVETIGKIKTQ